MIVGVDGRFFVEPTVGIGKYSINLMRSISNYDKSNSYIVFVDQPITNTPLFSEQFKFVVLRAPKRSLWEQVALPFALKKYRLDLYHCLGELGVSLVSNTASILTVLDIIPVLFDEYCSYRPNWVYKKMLPLMIQKCRKVITISNCSKKDIVNVLGVHPDKIEVIYPGVEECFRPLNEIERICIKLEQYGLVPGNYILYVGGLHPRKNLEGLLEAFKDYISINIRSKLFLVIVGMSSQYGNEVMAKVKALGIKQRVLFTGLVDEEALLCLYNGAKLFVYPSKYEGFGLPPLEAMACGCPVIVSKTSSLPEVVGEAGIYFNPEYRGSLLEAIMGLLNKVFFKIIIYFS